MSMRAIYLNHAIPQEARSWRGMLLLVTGVVLCGVVLLAIQKINVQVETLEADASRFQHPEQSSRHQPGTALPKEEISAVQAAMAELALPWEALFTALEQTRTPRVKLLSIEPNAKQHKLRITAQAPEMQDMLGYVQLLEQQPMLKDVLLRQHERDDGGISFVIDAVWELKP